MSILKFSGFLNEMELSQEYKDVIKTYPLSYKKELSKSVVEPKTVSPEGWGQLFLLNEDGVILNAGSKQKLELKSILDGFLHHDKQLTDRVPKILATTLNMLGDNETIKKYKPNNYENYKYFILDLGKIVLYNGNFNLYPVFVPGHHSVQRFRGGHLYAVAYRNSDSEPELMSFFYSDDLENMSPTYLADQALYHLKKVMKRVTFEKIDREDFMENYKLVSPYGEDFVLTLDFKKPTEQEILSDALRQINKSEPSEVQEEPKRIGMSVADRESTQISLKPGKKLGLIIPYISETQFTMVTIKEIVSLQEIQNAMKFRKGLSEIDNIIISCTLDGEDSNKIIRSTLKRGSRVSWKSKGEMKQGKISSNGSMITPDINMLSKGIVPVRVTV